MNELLLCLTDAKKEKEMLENTLREVNEFVVPDTEFLSDAVYFTIKNWEILSDKCLTNARVCAIVKTHFQIEMRF